ncbi:hypothetical protein MKW94_025389, partial [Papaver nudicaule]|nr:hypothetical protein [Papaver nudicaule]
MNLTQSWHKHGTCPEETIPILRFSNNYNPKATLPRKHFSDSGDVYRKNNQDITNQHEVYIS